MLDKGVVHEFEAFDELRIRQINALFPPKREAPFKIRFPWTLEVPEVPSKTTRLIGWVWKRSNA
jgi:hypothetical protein